MSQWLSNVSFLGRSRTRNKKVGDRKLATTASNWGEKAAHFRTSTFSHGSKFYFYAQKFDLRTLPKNVSFRFLAILSPFWPNFQSSHLKKIWNLLRKKSWHILGSCWIRQDFFYRISVKRIDKIIKICGFIKNVLCEKCYVTWIYHHFFSTIFFLMKFYELKKLNFDSW